MINLGLVFGLTALYFTVILAVVVYSRFVQTKRLLPDLDEFFLAGKKLSPIILAATFAASYFSTWTVLGLPGMVYAQGMGALYFVYIIDLVGLFAVLWLGPKFMAYAQEHRVFSPVEVISAAYSSRKLGILLSVIFIVFLMPYISLQLVGVGKFIEGYTAGQVNYVTSVGSMLVIVLIYLFLGGMRAVAYTDIIQMVAILIGVGFGLHYLLMQNDLSYFSLVSESGKSLPDIFSAPGPFGVWTLPMVISTGLVSVGILFQPHLLTRTMMASKGRDIKILVFSTLTVRIVMSFFSIGLVLAAYKLLGPELESNAMMGHIFEMMASTGTMGLVLSTLMLMGALGAAMSTADSLLISIGQVATRDIVRPNIKVQPHTQILISKGIMLLVLVLAFLTGLNPPKIMVDLGIYSGAGCALLIPTILCFRWKCRSLTASFVSILVGLVSLIALAGYKFATGDTLFGMHAGFVPLVLSFALYFSISLFTYERDGKK